ncbi:MAG TPA: LysR family transcriptional regulator [Candidatus Binatia bacterium]
MTIHQIRILLAVAKYTSITKASQALHISEPAVHQQLKALHSNFGRTFYRKQGRGIVLTPDGEAFCKRAAAVIERFEELEEHFSGKINERGTKSLSIGGSHLFSISVLSPLIAQFKQTQPEVDVTLRIKSSSVIESAILKSKIDIALITNSSYSTRLTVEPFRREHVVVIVSARHRWAKKRRLTLAEFATGFMILRDRKETNGWKILDEAERKGFQLKVLMKCDSVQSVKDAVMRGLGCGVVYRYHVVHEIKRGELKVVKIQGLSNLERESSIVYKAGIPLSKPAQAFLNLLRHSSRIQSEVSHQHPRLHVLAGYQAHVG